MRITELGGTDYVADESLANIRPKVAARDLTQSSRLGASEAPALVASWPDMWRAAEKFQLLRVWFEEWASSHRQRVVMISSALPREGKSFVALNLAAALAAAGNPVMLIDADLRNPCLHRALNLAPTYGLADFLEGRVDLKACLAAVPLLPTLTLVAGGSGSRVVAQLMAGPRMSDSIDYGRTLQPRHYVLIDCGPVLAAPETTILAGLVDAALFVVAADRTPRQMVGDAVQLLQNTTVCGLVMNHFAAGFSTSRRVANR